MSGPIEIQTQSFELRAASRGEAREIALAAPQGGDAALAEAADVELGAAAGGVGAEIAAGPAIGSAITCAAGTPVGWSELDEWLEAS
jgi:hypothetical protein